MAVDITPRRRRRLSTADTHTTTIGSRSRLSCRQPRSSSNTFGNGIPRGIDLAPCGAAFAVARLGFDLACAAADQEFQLTPTAISKARTMLLRPVPAA